MRAPLISAVSCVSLLSLATTCEPGKFVVVNRTPDPLAVTVEVLSGWGDSASIQSDGFAHPTLELAPALDSGEVNPGPWTALDSVQLAYDSAGFKPMLKISFIVPPQHALRLDSFWTLRLEGRSRRETLDTRSAFKRRPTFFLYEFRSRRAV